ncbi:Hypothetical predicted protein [Lecanosticta acicola]|uniref:Uncharacterized protein n=1 Tax=Lecanosticta acicola TaxID=111012 RepID=A0AAI8Z9A5_9PEZI|nr:Hypothetical predicted protein [Lecanosticta acicola]
MLPTTSAPEQESPDSKRTAWESWLGLPEPTPTLLAMQHLARTSLARRIIDSPSWLGRAKKALEDAIEPYSSSGQAEKEPKPPSTPVPSVPPFALPKKTKTIQFVEDEIAAHEAEEVPLRENRNTADRTPSWLSRVKKTFEDVIEGDADDDGLVLPVKEPRPQQYRASMDAILTSYSGPNAIAPTGPPPRAKQRREYAGSGPATSSVPAIKVTLPEGEDLTDIESQESPTIAETPTSKVETATPRPSSSSTDSFDAMFAQWKLDWKVPESEIEKKILTRKQ